jgi:hypothetical protein
MVNAALPTLSRRSQDRDEASLRQLAPGRERLAILSRAGRINLLQIRPYFCENARYIRVENASNRRRSTNRGFNALC